MTDNGMTVTTPNPTGAGSGEVIASPFPSPEPITTNPSKGAKVRLGDRIFGGLAQGAGVAVVVLIAAIAVFLLWRKDSTDFFRPTGRYDPSIDAHVKPPTTLT